MKRLVLVFCSLMMANGANSADWVEFIQPFDGMSKIYIDMESIRQVNPKIIGSYNEEIYSVFLKQGFKKKSKQWKSGYSYANINFLINCDQSTYFILGEMDYNQNNKMVHKEYANTSLLSQSDFKPGFPDTTAGILINEICQ